MGLESFLDWLCKYFNFLATPSYLKWHLRFVSFIGIAYQLPGSIAGERALLLTEHMKAMGLLDSARIM